MTGTQAPKGFAVLFVLVGIPYILWGSWDTNKQIEALNATQSRKASCVAKIAHLPLSAENVEAMCSCMVRKAEERGITQRAGSYDVEALKPIVESCYAANVPG